MGMLPTGGAEVPTFLSYGVEKRLSKHRDEFGHGAIEGVAGPEAANNAAFGGVLVPMLTLGLPTSATAAIMLTAFQQYGIQPGPSLFTEQSALLWALIASMYIGNVMLVVLNLPLVRLWVKLLEIPKPLLYSAILVFACLGVFSADALDVRPLPDDRRRRPRLRDADVRHPGGADDRRADPRSGDGSTTEPGAEHQPTATPSVFFTRPAAIVLLALAVLAIAVPQLPRLVRVVRGEARGGTTRARRSRRRLSTLDATEGRSRAPRYEH